MQELERLIRMLENEIKAQRYLLENYIGQRAWGSVYSQESYVAGLDKALVLAQALYSELNAHQECYHMDGSRRE